MINTESNDDPMIEDSAIDRRGVLKTVGAVGFSAVGVSGVVSAKGKSRSSGPYTEKELSGRDRGQFISHVRKSEQFKSIKKILISEGFTPHMKRPTPKHRTHTPTNSEGNRLVIPFKEHNVGETDAIVYAYEGDGSDGLSVVGRVTDRQSAKQQPNDPVLRLHISNEQTLAQEKDGVRTVRYNRPSRTNAAAHLKTVSENKDVELIEFKEGSEEYLFKRHKKGGKLEYREMPEYDTSPEANGSSGFATASLPGLDEVVERVDPILRDIGSGNTPLYNRHAYIGTAVETGKGIGQYTTTFLGGVLCTLVPIPGARLALLFGGGCAILGRIAAGVLNVDTRAKFTFGAWDNDQWFGPEAAYGASSEYGADYNKLTKTGSVGYAHISGLNSVEKTMYNG